MNKNISVLFAALALSGCATLVNGSTQSVAVSSDPTQGAQCTLANSVGSWVLVTPGSVVIHKSKTDLAIRCSRDGYLDAQESVTADFGGATFGNIVAGGIIGVAIDAGSGANYSYRSPIIVQMDKSK